MADIRFWQKPGCQTNGRQRAMLGNAGHRVEALDLLTEAWTADRLLGFFRDLPVSQWFNRASPRIKSGEIDPLRLDAGTAMALLLADPLLIRRPLIETDGWRCAGFDTAEIDRVIGLGPTAAAHDGPVEGCAHGGSGSHACPTPARSPAPDPAEAISPRPPG